MKNPTVLIAECDETLRQNLINWLPSHGFDLIEANGIKDIIRSLQDHQPDLVIIGSVSKRINEGLKATKMIRRLNRIVPIILIIKHSSEAHAIAALRAGVNDYFKLPFSEETLLTSIQRNLPKTFPRTATIPDSGATCRYYVQPMIGKSPSMQEIKTYLNKIAAADSNVLITGETGTGKELAAEIIHRTKYR